MSPKCVVKEKKKISQFYFMDALVFLFYVLAK